MKSHFNLHHLLYYLTFHEVDLISPVCAVKSLKVYITQIYYRRVNCHLALPQTQ